MSSRDDQEFAEYFLGRGPALRRTAYLIVHDWHLAEDLTQRSFVKLYAAWWRVRAETRDAYVRRIVVNECLSHLRRRPPETPADSLPYATTTYDETPLDLGQALALLPHRQRAVVALRFLDDLSVHEVANALRISEGTVKSQTSRALATLRTHLPDLITASTHEELR